MACKIAVFALLAGVAARQPHLITDDLKELEAHEATTVEDVKKEEAHFRIKFNPESQRDEAKDEIAKADVQAKDRVIAQEMDNIDEYGHPKDNSPETVAKRVYEQDIIARSAADAEKWNQKRKSKEQKECLAQCLSEFHGSLRTCSKKCPVN
eukprot:gnl/MRDRNA2_/MRDRNA2_36717_c0_seq1.p1 gnl/MRDRNA2_/MRDRNA2_36717_c0~~gnl/MRDRNA2_/MRDRNA2_36717_c0_seq1.p1  ORF type:complete len:152 (+),score=45.65 gnl/MRDRNA2_/MRDRNA2_36717_c0_seq1:106-561(+)